MEIGGGKQEGETGEGEGDREGIHEEGDRKMDIGK